ncbi:MAG: lipoprotein-releasing system permease protein [Colwellia sp.]|jgi:lipoprotein-releasing system permease protein|uniref:lipoprotein-releasing ABC transporter permease subunit n=1 Tax=unclassified Colwellia TaxID=196834 RepID=UPI0015F5F304|nr:MULTISPECIES: lipoprotein-releasing ABC transporter permease subunit [unclassified Colwellia]MBA6251409.1 lipoprotein-releasing ABC transporter permease subunit [Colwellia sp. MB3u-55]MBA6399339.1 lipoprotein-releasing ABC transporter permease subunit [Colwellia sp. BRX10-4]
MFQPVSFFIGLRYSRSRKSSGFVSFITFFSIVGIVLGVASLITVVSVMDGLEGEQKRRILGLVPHIVVANQPLQNKNNALPTWQILREQLLLTPKVKEVTPLLESEALIQANSGALRGVLIQGIMPEFEQHNIVNNSMVSGHLDNLSTQSFAIVIGQSLARQLDVDLGDKIRLTLPNKTVFTPMGRIPVQRTFTIAGIFSVGSQVDEGLVYIHSKDGAKLHRQRGDGVEKLRLYLDDAFAAEQVVKRLKQQYPQYDFTTWRDTQGALFSAVRMEKNMMWLMLSLIIAVAAFNIVSALVMVVIEKKGEISILQTLGLDRLGVVKIFITQGLVNGFWGVTIGTVVGAILTLNLNTIFTLLGVNLLGAGQSLPVELSVNNVFSIVLSALAMSFIATLYPAYQASLTEPAEVLRNE